MVTWDNYEEYMMLYADGELQPAEEVALLEFVNQHPALMKELNAYKATVLPVDESMVYNDKKLLIKPVPATRKFVFAGWKQYSIAAGIAALLFLSVMKFLWTDKQPVEVAKTTIDSVIKPDAAKVAHKSPDAGLPVNESKSNNSHDLVSVTKKERIVGANTVKKPNKVVANMPVAKINKVESVPGKSSNAGSEIKVTNIDLMGKMNVSDVAVVGLIKISSDSKPVAPNVIRDVPQIAMVAEDEDEGGSLWSKIPLDDLKKDKMAYLAKGIAHAYKEVHAAREELEEKKLSIKVEKRKILISF